MPLEEIGHPASQMDGLKPVAAAAPLRVPRSANKRRSTVRTTSAAASGRGRPQYGFGKKVLRARVGPVLDVSFQRIKVKDEPQFPSAVAYFLCSIGARGEPRLDPHEHAEFAWVTKRDLNKFAVVPRLERAINRAYLTDSM